MMHEYEHQREIPRDLFNEAKLLKCMGLLSLRIHDGNTPTPMTLDWNREKFDVRYDIDGDTYISNMTLYVNDEIQEVRCLMNSKDNYPMVFQNNLERVFEEDGKWNENLSNSDFFE